MKCICIAGASYIDLTAAEEILIKSGMLPPKGTDRNQRIDMSTWHEQALAMQDGFDEEALRNPGRFMEQMVSDIFIANMQSTLWGWADTRSTWLLDFWKEYDPRVYFVLVCVSPDQLLAHAISSESFTSFTELMDVWQQYHQQLLRFHLRNPQRSILIDVVDTLTNPNQFIAHIADQWKVDLASSEAPYAIQQTIDPLALFVARQLCVEFNQDNALYNEIQATCRRFSKQVFAIKEMPDSAETVISCYRKDQHQKAQVLQQAQQAVDELTEKNYQLLSVLTEKQGELEAFSIKCNELDEVCDQLNQQLESSAAQLAQQQSDANARVKVAEQENELLLLQLHQVQEELEAHFLKYQQVEVQLHALQSELNLSREEREGQSHQLTDYQTRVDQLNQQLESSAAQLAQQQSDANARVKVAEQENELLLLQLHQVQEELEHYFLQHQGKDKQLQQAEDRWQRMLERTPDYCDYESLIIDVDVDEKEYTSHWQFTDIEIAKRLIPAVTFTVRFVDDITSFIFHCVSKNTPLLIRWPNSLVDQDEIKISFDKEGNTEKQLVKVLLELSSSDWDLLGALTRWLNRIVQTPSSIKLPADFPIAKLNSGLIFLNRLIQNLSSGLRYDQIRLKREQVNPDYEHLWIQLNQFSFANRVLSEFDFRLSCGNVRPNFFGYHPKLEFPKGTGNEAFEDWFVEAYDDFGEKLELRFALPEAMDMTVWERLTAHDQTLLMLIIQQLPNILGQLQHSGQSIKRPWDDWLQMVDEVQRIYTLRVSGLENQPKPLFYDDDELSVLTESSAKVKNTSNAKT
jgi:hypothetical protein